ncbi:MAG: ankyrin repeat domain-containing protein [Sedimentisphaerales bacterium]|nr:ankyrin repeat domain-containing protein [Sedimentisphaerales bacterium]
MLIKYKVLQIFNINLITIILMFIIFGCERMLTKPTVAEKASSDPNRYLDAVREFADNVLKYGRDTYGPKHTPLFVDGVNVTTNEPVKWISPKGDLSQTLETEEWILSNFASQQTLLRTLDGLSALTGNAKYRDAAEQAVKYAFDNLRTPNGLFYWGEITAYDALGDRVRNDSNMHALKRHYPYYELMWQVNPEATQRFVEAYWSGHIIDWSNLDFNRDAVDIDLFTAAKTPWDNEYKGGEAFFTSKVSWARGFLATGTSLAHAAITLHQLSGQEPPLVWSKRLIQRFVDARHPNTGISPYLYNYRQNSFVGGGMEEHFRDRRVGLFPINPFVDPSTSVRSLYSSEEGRPHVWLSMLLMGEELGEQGKEFTQWALEELTAWGKASYRIKDNVFMPILTDGTPIEGIMLEENSSGALKGSIAEPLFADAGFLWAYATAYKATGDSFMWQMTRDIVQGNGFGDIGEIPGQAPSLNRNTTNANVYSLLGFLELYKKTRQEEFLGIARRIADNILSTEFYNGFFVSSNKDIYVRFDCFEPLALLHLAETLKEQQGLAPRVWPTSPIFVAPYRYNEEGIDNLIIYTLTETPELPLSLQEAAAIGNVDLVRSFIESGAYIEGVENPMLRTALYRAVMSDHRDVIELLLAYGADINTKDFQGRTPLACAFANNNVDLAKLLLSAGADVNATLSDGRTLLREAIERNNVDLVKLSLSFNAEVNKRNTVGRTMLHIACLRSNREIVALLIASGADIDAKDNGGLTALDLARQRGNKEIIELLTEAMQKDITQYPTKNKLDAESSVTSEDK